MLLLLKVLYAKTSSRTLWDTWLPIDPIIKYITKMARNYISNNIDFMQPTQYTISKNRVAKKPPPEPEPLPAFEPPPIYSLIWEFWWCNRTTYCLCMYLFNWCARALFYRTLLSMEGIAARVVLKLMFAYGPLLLDANGLRDITWR